MQADQLGGVRQRASEHSFQPLRMAQDACLLYGMAVYWVRMIFIEATTFSKLLPKYLTDEEYRTLQTYLMQKPDAGDLVRGSGGVRKVRWAPEGKGKSGGIRVIYYWKRPDHEIWMLTIYSKSERSTIPGHVLKQIAEAIDYE